MKRHCKSSASKSCQVDVEPPLIRYRYVELRGTYGGSGVCTSHAGVAISPSVYSMALGSSSCLFCCGHSAGVC